MRRLVVIAFAVALALPAPASAARVEVMVVGQDRVLHGPSEVRLKVREVKVAGAALPRRRRDCRCRCSWAPG